MHGYLLLTVLLIGAVQTPVAESAPIDSDSILASSSNNGQFQRNELQKMLIEALFNSTDNFYLIKNAFQQEPGVHKICIPVRYSVTCTDQQPEDSDKDLDHFFNCTNGYTWGTIWTEFDTKTIAGNLLIYFASNGFSVFGFDWGGACDTDDVKSLLNTTTVLVLTVPSLSCSEKDLQLVLLYITTLVSSDA